MYEVALVASLVSIIFTGITAFFSIVAYCKVVGMEKSTHKIEWMPLPNDGGGLKGENLVKAFKEKMYPDMENEYV